MIADHVILNIIRMLEPQEASARALIECLDSLRQELKDHAANKLNQSVVGDQCSAVRKKRA